MPSSVRFTALKFGRNFPARGSRGFGECVCSMFPVCRGVAFASSDPPPTPIGELSNFLGSLDFYRNPAADSLFTCPPPGRPPTAATSPPAICWLSLPNKSSTRFDRDPDRRTG